MNSTTARKSTATLRLKHQARWAHKRADAVKALRAGYSIGAVARALDVPETSVKHWRVEEAIPPHTGKPRPIPEVGAKLA
jgi:transposase-like protein